MNVFLREVPYENHFPPVNSSLLRQGNQERIKCGVEYARDLLLGELALADSAFSGRNRACVLETGAGLYGGHSLEFANGMSVSAEEMALGRIASGSELVETVYVTARGVKKPKHAMPSAAAYDLLLQRMHPRAEMVLVRPDTFDSCLAISPQAHRDAYACRPLSILGNVNTSLAEEVHEQTILDWEDATFVAALGHQGAKHGIRYHLTGSSSDRGGASSLLSGDYGDMDIIAVSGLPREEVEQRFEGLADMWYEDIVKSPHDVILWPTCEVRPGVTYNGYCRVRGWPVGIDFFVATSLEQAVVRPETLERNMYHGVA